MLNLFTHIMLTSDQACLCRELGLEGFALTPIPGVACSVHPPMSMADTPKEAQVTVNDTVETLDDSRFARATGHG